MNFLKSHFWYNKNQRNGILFLIFIIIFFQLIYFFVDFSENENYFESATIVKLQQQIDSLKDIKKANKSFKIYPFNPNYISDYKGYQLGMSTSQIDNLFSYRESGKFINTTAQFQEITKISDSLLLTISPYFKFPSWPSKTVKKAIRSKIEFEQNKHIIKRDINLCSEKELMAIDGIGDKLSKRIISYRNLLQGFSFNEQLYEVYYLKKEVANDVLKEFEVIQKPTIVKLDINTANFKELLHLPYIDYPLTQDIVNYRNKVKQILSLDELKKIDSFPLEKFDRITLYLQVD